MRLNTGVDVDKLECLPLPNFNSFEGKPLTACPNEAHLSDYF